MSIFKSQVRLGALLPLADIASMGVIAACSSGGDVAASPISDPVPAVHAAPAELVSGGADAGACAPAIDLFRELEIVHPNVVNSPAASSALDGHWSFRFLVEQMAPRGVDPSVFVLDLLKTWETAQVINGVPLEARPSIDSVVINP